MKNKLRLFSIFLVILAFPISAAAQLIVSPASLDLGDVEVGQSASAIVTIMNGGGSEILLDVALTGDEDFSISSDVPGSIVPYGVVDIQITFTPSEVGLATADLVVNGVVGSTLSGVGVPIEPPPSQSVSDILDFFDASVADGSLVGNGPGNSAEGRKGALRNMIEAAGDLIEDGAMAESCQQLLDAFQRSDGVWRPPEFVAGPAAPTLAGMILDLMASLGCDQ